MATYIGSDKRLAYLFANGGGGGECKVISGYYHNGDFYEDQSYTQVITGDTECLYIDLDTTTLYLFDGTDYVEVQGGGGGEVSDGTVGTKIDISLASGASITYTREDLNITTKGCYLFSITSGHNAWMEYLGYFFYGGHYPGYQVSGIFSIRSSYLTVSYSDSVTGTFTIKNTSSYGENQRIEIMPLHPKVEIPKHTYSTTERIVGTWIDGKPIYERTVDLGVNQMIPQNSWYSSGILISDVALLIEVKGIGEAGAAYNLNAYPNNSEVMLQTARDGNAGYVKWVIIQYTKSTD